VSSFVLRRCSLATAACAAVAGLGVPQLALGDDRSARDAPAAGPTVLASNQVKVRYAPGKLIVGIEEDASGSQVGRALARAGADVERVIGKIDARVVEVPQGDVGEAIASLRANPAVEYVEREVLLERSDTVPNDALWSGQWGPKLVRAPRAWDATRGRAATVIAVLDTGVAFGHPDLEGAFLAGYDFVNNDANPRDDHGHGTAVAGVIAARTHNERGQAGACWRCSLMPVKVLDASGWGTTSEIAAGIVWASDHGARVINLSLGGSGTTQTLADAVAYAVGKGVLVVAAAGNAGSTTRFFPAAYPGVVSVAATTPSDGLYEWSNRGTWVRLAAPGCNTAPRQGGGYENFCGTSSATPLVSGIAALALSLSPAISNVVLARALEASSVARPSGIAHGRVDALNALATLELVPPVNLRRPRIVGTASPGETLRAGHGRWAGAVTFAYRWKRCNALGKRCSAISGADGQDYTVRRADRGSRLRVVVRALNASGNSRAISRATAVVGSGATEAPPAAASTSTDADPEAASAPADPDQGDGSGASCVDCPEPSPPPPADPLAEVVSTVAREAEDAGSLVPEADRLD
jgi:subtilisin family serine protease